MKNHVIASRGLSCLALCAVCMMSQLSSELLAQSQTTGGINLRSKVLPPSQPIHVDVNLALVNVTVTDPHNRQVLGLEPNNFRVFENNVEQEIVNFSCEDIPISVGIILDLSGSMANKLAKTREAALQFLSTSNPEDEFFLVGFNDHAAVLSPFTNNVQDLQAALLSVSANGATAMLDAIFLGVAQMKSARFSKRALVVISDGGDNHSRYTERDIKRLIREADTQLYAIGIVDQLPHRSRTEEEFYGPDLLSELTAQTGGRTFFLRDINTLPVITAKIGT